MSILVDQMVNLFILVVILGIGTAAFFAFGGNQGAQLLVGITIAISYSVWGLIHHWVVGELHNKIVIEYVLIGGIAVTMLLMILGN